MWVVKYGPSKVHSHIQVLDVKHICYAAMGRQKMKIQISFYHYYLRKQVS